MGRIDERTREIVPPFHLAMTFERDPDNVYGSGNVYGRPDNDPVREAETVIGALVSAARPSRSARVCRRRSRCSLGASAQVIAPQVIYWALRVWLTDKAPALGLNLDFVETDDHEASRRQMQGGFGGMLSISRARRRGDRRGVAGQAVEARDLVGRHRVADQAQCLD